MYKLISLQNITDPNLERYSGPETAILTTLILEVLLIQWLNNALKPLRTA